MSWYLEQLQRDGTVLTRVEVQGASAGIGRALDNTLVLDDAHVAAHHARLEIDAEGRAALVDLGTRNGIALPRGRRAARIELADDQPVRLGQTLIRLRHSSWPLAAEVPLTTRWMWLIALAALICVLADAAWDVWLTDLGEKSPPYLNLLAGTAAALALWSSFYALLGRLIGGVERFFSHLLIACCGYLILVLVHRGIDLLAFASGWVWPLQIAHYVSIALVAGVVRQHLRLADPRHWPALRWAVGVVACGVALVPLAQLWISEGRLTRVQTVSRIEHPALRLAAPHPAADLLGQTERLRARVDEARKREAGGEADEFDIE
jgi:pSer/pThr/pTyr-binding forkhead associated (FHA) protein